MLFMPSPSDIGSQLDIFNRNKASSSEAIDISSPVDARNGIVRIFTTDDIDHPTSAATGSGFGVGVIGTETSVFLTNRHVVVDSRTGKIADHVYIMLNDNAVKEVYTPFGDFPNEEMGSRFKLVINPDYLVECEVLYPTDQDPEFPDYAVIRAARKIEGRVALQLISTSEVEDTSEVCTIGFPGSADKIYNLASDGTEMNYAADPESAQLFKGTISRRGSLQYMGNTMALTHNAQIDHGNSGGPLVEESGKVVGINTYGFGSADTSSVGYYLSIYIDYAMDKLKELGIPFNLTVKDAKGKDLQALEGWDPNSRPVSGSSGRSTPPEGKMTVSLKKMEVNFTEEGEIDYVLLYDHNKYGEWTSLEERDAEGNLDHRSEFTLDDRGERIKQQTFYEDGTTKYSETEYDEDGKELKWKSFDENGEMDAWVDYSYDGQGVLSRKIFHYSSGSVEYTDYNGQGKPEKSERYDKDNNLEEVQEYDTNGNRISDTEYDKDGNVTLLVYEEYDDSRNRIMYIYQKGDYFSGNIYSYNGNGDILSEAKVDQDGNILELQQYTYFEGGYKIEKFNGDQEPVSITLHMEDDFGHGTTEYDLDGNILSNSEWRYDYDEDGFLNEESYFRDCILKSRSIYEVTDVDINPLEPEDYTAGTRSTQRRTKE